MAQPQRVKITVLKRLSVKEVYGRELQHVSPEMSPYCHKLQEGQEFIVDEKGDMPAGFCTWAWHDVYPEVTTLRFGGNFSWITKDGLVYSCCSDGVRPVFFKIERL